MTPWCAAFANWCIERARMDGSRSASSQSFLSRDFRRVTAPKAGDLTVFTSYDPADGRPLGGGHVAFFIKPADDGKIVILGGNQSGDGHSSIISMKAAPTMWRVVDRRTGTVKSVTRLNAYVSLT